MNGEWTKMDLIFLIINPCANHDFTLNLQSGYNYYHDHSNAVAIQNTTHTLNAPH